MSFESDGSNLVILHVYRKLDVISAQRVVTVCMMVSVGIEPQFLGLRLWSRLLPDKAVVYRS